VGLIVVAMIGSLIGSIGLAAIGAEHELTANLAPATMYVAVPVVLSVVSVIAAFEVLAAIYLPDSKMLFVLITAAAGLCGVCFNSFAVVDAWQSSPDDDLQRTRWLETQWHTSPSEAYSSALEVAAVSAAPIVLGAAARFVGIHISGSDTVTSGLIGAGLLLAVAGALKGMVRTVHSPDGMDSGVGPREAIGTNLAIGLYVLVLMILLP
jgi:hypothetical protein